MSDEPPAERDGDRELAPSAERILRAITALGEDIATLKGNQDEHDQRILDAIRRLVAQLIEISTRVSMIDGRMDTAQEVGDAQRMRPARLPVFESSQVTESMRVAAEESQKQTASLRVTAEEAEKQTEHLRVTANESQKQTKELKEQTPILNQVASGMQHVQSSVAQSTRWTAIASALGVFTATVIGQLISSCGHH